MRKKTESEVLFRSAINYLHAAWGTGDFVTYARRLERLPDFVDENLSIRMSL